jgi:hypothetical protein
MSTLTTERSGTDPIAATRGLVVAAGAAATIGCIGYISTIVLLSDLSVRDAARSPLTITSNLIVAAAFAVVAAGLPTLIGAARLPRWAGILATVGCVFVVANAWGTGTLAVHAAGLLTDAQMDQNSGWFTLFQAGQSLPAGIGLFALGFTGWRRRALSRGASALLIVAGVASLVPAYPPGALLTSLALIWTARTARTDQHPPAA